MRMEIGGNLMFLLSFKILEIINQKLAENTETLVNNIKAAIENENNKI